MARMNRVDDSGDGEEAPLGGGGGEEEEPLVLKHEAMDLSKKGGG